MTDELTDDLEDYYADNYPPLTPDTCPECGAKDGEDHETGCPLADVDPQLSK